MTVSHNQYLFWLALKINSQRREKPEILLSVSHLWFCFTHHLICLFCCLVNSMIFVAGTFARVCLCRERNSRDYFALKILAIHDVIRLKQVEHVKNEKNILKVSRQTFIKEKIVIQQQNLFVRDFLRIIQAASQLQLIRLNFEKLKNGT